MNPAVFALRHPITTFMLVVGLMSGGGLALNKMQVDIFPDLHVPKIYVFLQYGGMSPEQMEGFVVCQFELLFQYVDGVKEIKSRNIQQCSLVELSFHNGTDMAGALASVVAMANRAVSRMPPGTLPPMVMRMDAGSVPVGYLVLKGKTTPLGKVADFAQNIVRPAVSANVPGTVAVSPFGPNIRTILVKCDPKKLQDYNLSPQDVTDALMTGNTVVPAGNVYVRDSMPMVPNNATVSDIKDIGKIPLKLGLNVYIRDVATVEDATDLDYGYALVNRTSCCYLPIIKKSDASTLQVVADIHESMDLFRSLVPPDVTVDFEFDESPTVVEAVKSVGTEGAIGAILTGLMILLFLRDWRSVIVVVCNIPLALLGSLVGLWLSGNTINIMSLGGMALAIGILVDESTVTIENTHVQMEHTPKLATAVLRAANATAVARLLAMLCILSVFTPSLVMEDPLHSLFMPLTMAVGFALISSYLLSSTFVPIMSVYLLKHHRPKLEDEQKGLFARFQRLFRSVVALFLAWRWVVVSAYVVGCGLVLWQVGGRLGAELFPQVDSGEFVLRFRPPPGSSYKLTREMLVKCLDEIDREAGPGKVSISLGYAGQVAPNFGMNNMVLFMRGPDDAWLRVALREDSGIRLDDLRERLRKSLPERLTPWMAERLRKGGVPREEALRQARTISFCFQPGDMVTEVMSFGASTPIAVRVVGADLDLVRSHANKVAAQMRRIPFLRDVGFEQQLDYPGIRVDVDREKAGLSDITVRAASDPVIEANSSSRFIALNYWVYSKTGFDYQVEVLVPPAYMTSKSQVEKLPLRQVNPLVNLMLRDVAQVSETKVPGEIDRSASLRYITINSNVEGEDIGRAARQVEKAIADAGTPPRGVRVQVMGQLPPMRDMFDALGVGLALALFVILVLLTAYFQSPRLALVSISAAPGVLAGVAVMLSATNTTLNIESFMGAIMCLGVSVSNSVMLVTFMAEHWRAGASGLDAALIGASERLRPILMTACAMIVGMIPMSMGLEKGSQMESPLGRAVVGGLLMSTFATLLVAPAVFAVVIGAKKHFSPSLSPEHPESAHFDPEFAQQRNGPPAPAPVSSKSPTGPGPESPS